MSSSNEEIDEEVNDECRLRIRARVSAAATKYYAEYNAFANNYILASLTGYTVDEVAESHADDLRTRIEEANLQLNAQCNGCTV